MAEAATYNEKIDLLRLEAERTLRAARPDFDEPVHVSLHSLDLEHAGTTALELLESSKGAVRAISQFFRSWEQDDVAITNDPDVGAMNATEFIAVAPIFSTALAGWVAVRSRVPDFGGWEFGGYSPQAVDRWAEGARVEPAKFLKQGRPRREVVDLIKLNSRTPQVTERIVNGLAEIALNIAARSEAIEKARTEALAAETSTIDTFLGALGADSGEIRQAVAVPAGTVDAVLTVRVRSLAGSLSVSIDAPPVVPHNFNLGRYGAFDMVQAAVAAAIGDRSLSTEVLSARLKVEVREPSIAAALLPATVGLGRETTGQAIFRATLRALMETGSPSIDVDAAWRNVEKHVLGTDRVDVETGMLTTQRAEATKKIMMEEYAR